MTYPRWASWAQLRALTDSHFVLLEILVKLGEEAETGG